MFEAESGITEKNCDKFNFELQYSIVSRNIRGRNICFTFAFTSKLKAQYKKTLIERTKKIFRGRIHCWLN